MNKNQSFSKLLLIAFLLIPFVNQAQTNNTPQWPSITQQNKPWTRWWWEGSAVDTTNLKWMLTEYQKVGLGGLEITPIYGVKGEESLLTFYRQNG